MPAGTISPAAREHITDPDRLLIVSAGARLQGDLAAFMVPADARLQARFSGTRRALNARIGAHLLSAGIRGKDEATAYLARLLAAQPPIPRYDRKKQSDREILDLIARRLAQAPATSANRLLREFRDAGLACEQHRFSRLYRTVGGGDIVTARTVGPVLKRRALRVTQASDAPLYLLSLTAREIGQIADISRVSRDDAGDLIGYQRPEVRKHVQEITEYLDGDQVLFPNPIIIALPSTVRFACSRGPAMMTVCAVAGTLKIPLPNGDGRKPGWIVDGQQRALALARSRRQDFPVPVNAFVADSVELQRDQFLRINNTRPLPRGLVTELLPEISTPLPPRLSLRQTPAALCDLLNRDPDSPFCGLIRRPSGSKDQRGKAVITDTIIVQMLQESLTTPSGCLFPFRNPSNGETDFAGLWKALHAVLDRRA